MRMNGLIHCPLCFQETGAFVILRGLFNPTYQFCHFLIYYVFYQASKLPEWVDVVSALQRDQISLLYVIDWFSVTSSIRYNSLSINIFHLHWFICCSLSFLRKAMVRKGNKNGQIPSCVYCFFLGCGRDRETLWHI